MRLLNTHTLELEHYPDVRSRPEYAILSHMWGDTRDEVSYVDIMSGIESYRHKKGFAKIQYTCDEARENGIDYAWVDTCCIDKTSSAELSEAINSMFQWYRNSVVCYAYLADVSYWPTEMADMQRLFESAHYETHDAYKSEWLGSPSEGRTVPVLKHSESPRFEGSRWFSRGWTLQELIAPKRVKFYNREWTFIGSKRSLASTLTKVTQVPVDVLLHRRHLEDCSIARRMSWASRRQTTRIEDESYCLLGIFGVHMPLLYGEETNAFIRLQKEIIGRSSDQSIFAWDSYFDNAHRRYFSSGPEYLASSPACFTETGTYAPMPRSTAEKPYNISHRGLEITTNIVYRVVDESINWTTDRFYNALQGLFDVKDTEVYAILDCFDTQRCTRRLALRLQPSDHPDPKLATEFTVRLGVSLEAALTEQIKVVRSITILNDPPKIAGGYISSVDLRVRCFFMYEWSSISSLAGNQTESEELSLDITRWYPADSWDPQHSIFTVHRSESPILEPTCGFIGKLCYTPRNRRTLGNTPFDVTVIVHLYLGVLENVEARFHLETDAASIESAWKAVNKYRYRLSPASETMASTSKCHSPQMGRWNVRILHIKPSTEDPYGTLAIAVCPLRSWKRVAENLLVIGTCAKRLSPLAWSRNIRLRKAHQEFRSSVENHHEHNNSRAPTVHAPRLMVKDLYCGRKRWRQARAGEIMDS